MITKENINDNLKFIGLDLEDLPDFLKNPSYINLNSFKLNNDREIKVYKYVPISEIDIFLTQAHRDDSIKEKYSKASHISTYLNPNDEKNVDKYADILEMFDKINVNGIEKIQEKQNKMKEKVPFNVSYDRSQLWQIYYQEEGNKYFMLVSTKDNTFDELFYLLKKKLENSDDSIFVPVTLVSFSEEYLSSRQINDLENYLWVFTKNWPISYEVYDKKNKMSIQIVGETNVYDGIKSIYKIVLKSKEEAEEFFKLLKALFILRTELGNAYDFKTMIDNNHSLSFFYNDKKMIFDELPNFIKEKYNETEIAIKELNYETNDLENKLKLLKQEVKQKDAEYFLKQKEISTYLEYKKTFFGKVKYFFRSKSKKNKKLNEIENEESIDTKETEKDSKKGNKPMQVYVDDKKFHTIDDLVTLYSLYEKGQRYLKDLKQDINALELRSMNVSKKIENATLYINEIDKHKKSIFDFWKFANKDELTALEMGEENRSYSENNLIKKFDFESDFEELGENVDKIQRTKLSNEELDNLFIATTDILPIVNMLKDGDMDKDAIDNILEQLKKDYYQEDRKEESFDIFGNMQDDQTKVKYIGSHSFRENEKSKFNILNINKNIDVFDFTEKLQMIVNYLNESFNKISSIYDMSIYKIVPISEKLHKNDFEVFNMSLDDEFKNYEYNQESAIKLVKLNIKENFPLLYFSNSVFYDNKNKTLPIGMNLSSRVLIDSNKFDFNLKDSTKFKVNHFVDKDDDEPKVIYVYVDEYELNEKK